MSFQLTNRLKRLEHHKATHCNSVHVLALETYEQIKEKMAILKRGGSITFATQGKRRRIHENDVVIIDDVME